MNLCCFKIRDIAKWAGDNSILLKLDRMEKAVTEMATQLEGYSRASGGQKRRNPGQANPSSLQKRLSAFQTPEEMRKRCAGHVRPPRCDRCCAALSPRRAIWKWGSPWKAPLLFVLRSIDEQKIVAQRNYFLLPNMACTRFRISSGAISSICVATHPRWPKGSSNCPRPVAVKLIHYGPTFLGAGGQSSFSSSWTSGWNSDEENCSATPPPMTVFSLGGGTDLSIRVLDFRLRFCWLATKLSKWSCCRLTPANL